MAYGATARHHEPPADRLLQYQIGEYSEGADDAAFCGIYNRQDNVWDNVRGQGLSDHPGDQLTATWCRISGVAKSVATEIGHSAGIAGIYNRATYAKEMREALERWAEHVQAIAN
jgi:hypothetical protein